MRLKYRNKPTVVDGLRFDSKKEAARWGELKLLAMTKQITDLKRQVSYDLTSNGVVVCKYRPDFCYMENGKLVVEDVKSPVTRKEPLYRLKVKLMKAVYGIDVREV